jgi:drug/metabolite transporter (DMT)-like permease
MQTCRALPPCTPDLAFARARRYTGRMRDHISHTGAVVSIVLVTIIWGVSFPTVQYALKVGVDVGVFMTLRFMLGAVGLALICVVCRSRFTRLLLIESGILGIVDFAAYWLQTDGLRFTTNAKAAFVTTLYVLITPILAMSFGDRLRRSEFLAVPVATLGLMGLFWNGGDPLGGWNRGDSEILGCALLFAVMILMIDRLSRRHDIIAMTFVQIAVMAGMSAAYLLLAPPPDMAASLRLSLEPGVMLSLGFNGLISTAFAFWVQGLMQSRLAATESAILFSLEPVFATLLAISGWLPGIHETMAPAQWLGGGLIIGASFIAAGRGHQAVARQS